MLPHVKKFSSGHSNFADRLSDLPDFILHHIISSMGNHEACRTSILSKRWTNIYATKPVLEFEVDCKQKWKTNPNGYSFDESYERRVNEIDIVIQRYSRENLSIKELRLDFTFIDPKFASRIDEWIGIAVQSRVEELYISVEEDGPLNYRVPDVLFSAKSLQTLDCSMVNVPYYKAIKLTSLSDLTLWEIHVEECMLQHLISSCPLTFLQVGMCSGLNRIHVPHTSNLTSLLISASLPADGTIIIETSSLEYIHYDGGDVSKHWPISLKGTDLLRNLRKLEVSSVGITDEIVHNLVGASVAILKLRHCHLLENLKISSSGLKKFKLGSCYGLQEVVIDAPNLNKFSYTGDVEPSLIIVNVHSECEISLLINPKRLDAPALFELKMLLTGSTRCKLLQIELCNYSSSQLLENRAFEFDEALKKYDAFLKKNNKKLDAGPSYKVKELELSMLDSVPVEASISALMDDLFWICQPDIISFRVKLNGDNKLVQRVLEALENMVKCWRHPLKRVEVERVDGCSFCSGLKSFDIRMKLDW